MANITIREIDNTSAGTVVSSNDVVYIPGFVTSNSNFFEPSTLAPAFEPKLCNSITEFESYFGTKPAVFATSQSYPAEFRRDSSDIEGRWAYPVNEIMREAGSEDQSYIMAKELINLGVPVVYERINVDSDIDVKVNGRTYRNASGDPVKVPVDPTVSAMYTALVGRTVPENHDIFENLKDKGEYSIKYLTSGAYPSFEYHSKSYSVNNLVRTFEEDAKVSIAIDTNILWSKFSNYDAHRDLTYAKHFKFSFINLEANASVDDTVDKYGWVLFLGSEAEDNTITWKLVNGNSDNTVDFPVICNESEIGQHYAGDEVKNCAIILNDFGVFVKGPVGTAFKIDNSLVYNSVEFAPIEDDAGSIISARMLDCASSRGDAVALIDHTNNVNRALNPVSTESVYYAISSPQSNFKLTSDAEFGAMFTPWCTFNCVKNGTSETLPGSYAYLTTLAKSLKTNPSWFAIAGASRGIVANFVAPHTEKRLTNAMADAYQPRNAIAINPITNIKPYGYTIWGNRTLKNNAIEGNLTATSFLNIRNLVSEVKKIAYTAAKRCMFEQNSDVLWIKFKSIIMPTLDKMVSGYGLSNYKIIKIDTTEKAKLVCHIKLYPVYAVEDFDITVFMEDEEVTIS